MNRNDLFPDREHPLKAANPELQQQVVERIAKAKKGPQAHSKDGHKASPSEASRGLPMGYHPYVSDEKLGYAWGMTRQAARKLIKHPEDMNPYQVDEMCDMLGVTRRWLRGAEPVNAYGTYEEPDVVADLYDTLAPEDKELICALLGRIAGDESVRAVRTERWIRRSQTWYDLHPDEANRIRRGAQNALEVADAFGLQEHPDVRLFLRSLPKPKRD